MFFVVVLLGFLVTFHPHKTQEKSEEKASHIDYKNLALLPTEGMCFSFSAVSVKLSSLAILAKIK